MDWTAPELVMWSLWVLDRTGALHLVEGERKDRLSHVQVAPVLVACSQHKSPSVRAGMAAHLDELLQGKAAELAGDATLTPQGDRAVFGALVSPPAQRQKCFLAALVECRRRAFKCAAVLEALEIWREMHGGGPPSQNIQPFASANQASYRCTLHEYNATEQRQRTSRCVDRSVSSLPFLCTSDQALVF